MSSREPRLSVVMVAGECRDRVQRALDCLCAQTARDSTEIVVVDLAADHAAPLVAPTEAPVEILRLPGVQEWAVARLAGLEHTTGAIVAFVEEHCFTEPGWAQALIEAHEGPWVSVGYAFRNANPQSYVSRSAMLADYGLWLDPVPRGRTFTTVWETGVTNYIWCRAMAAQRAHTAGWSLPRRAVQAVLTPAAAPLYRIARLVRTLGGRRPLWGAFAAGFPVILAVSVCAGFGEAAGYLLGAGTAETELTARLGFSALVRADGDRQPPPRRHDAFLPERAPPPRGGLCTDPSFRGQPFPRLGGGQACGAAGRPARRARPGRNLGRPLGLGQAVRDHGAPPARR